MHLPDLLPKRLHFIKEAPTDEALIDLLKPQIAVYVDFFENACEDETWCERHLTFFQQTLEWVTSAFFRDKFAMHFAKRIVAALQKHFRGLSDIIPKHLVIKQGGQEYLMNSLMVGVCSQGLYHQMRRVSGQGAMELEENISTAHFNLFKAYIEYGQVEDLWKSDEKELMKLHDEARQLGMSGFLDSLADILKRYLTGQNTIPYLILAHDELWVSLKNYCCDYINRSDLGVTLRKGDGLQFEFLDFNSSALELFSKLNTRITHLICSGLTTMDPHFGSVLNECPILTALDLSQSRSYSPFLNAVPAIVESLDLSMCPWLNAEAMKQLPVEVKRLALRGNTHLNYAFWPVLQRFTSLRSLDISSCPQINDAEVKMIAESASDLDELQLEGCSGIGIKGFREMAALNSRLRILNVSRTEIGDDALTQFASACPRLNVLIVERCTGVSEKGVLEAVRLAGLLQKIVLKGNRFSSQFPKLLKTKYPYLESIF